MAPGLVTAPVLPCPASSPPNVHPAPGAGRLVSVELRSAQLPVSPAERDLDKRGIRALVQIVLFQRSTNRSTSPFPVFLRMFRPAWLYTDHVLPCIRPATTPRTQPSVPPGWPRPAWDPDKAFPKKKRGIVDQQPWRREVGIASHVPRCTLAGPAHDKRYLRLLYPRHCRSARASPLSS
jgi:hypothetical protein